MTIQSARTVSQDMQDMQDMVQEFSPMTIIREAQADGVGLHLSPSGTIKVTGEGAAVSRWIPTIRDHKPEIIDAMQAANNNEPPTHPCVDPEALSMARANALRWEWQPDELALLLEVLAKQEPAEQRKALAAIVHPFAGLSPADFRAKE